MFPLLIHAVIAMHWSMVISPKPTGTLKGFWTTEKTER